MPLKLTMTRQLEPPLFYLVLFLCHVYLASSVFLFRTSSLIVIQPDTEYVYKYVDRTEMKHLGVFTTQVKLSIMLLDKQDEGFHCRLELKDFTIQYSNTYHETIKPPIMTWDLDEWFSFVMSEHGEIHTVYYSVDDDPEVINFKKSLLNQLSSKLLSAPLTNNIGKWSYHVNESSHEGHVHNSYTAEDSNDADSIKFRKQMQMSEEPEFIHRVHEREIIYSKILKVPHSILITDNLHDVDRFRIPDHMRRGRSTHINTNERNVGMNHTGMPPVDVAGKCTIDLIATIPKVSSHSVEDEMSDVTKDTLTVRHVPQETIPIFVIEEHLRGNLTCMRSKGVHHGDVEPVRCFTNLTDMLSRLSYEDAYYVADNYIRRQQDDEGVMMDTFNIIDALGSAATHATQMALTMKVLLATQSDASIIMAVLQQFVRLTNPPPEICVDVIEKIALADKHKFEDKKDYYYVKNRAILVLGSVAKTLKGIKHSYECYTTSQAAELLFVVYSSDISDNLRHEALKELEIHPYRGHLEENIHRTSKTSNYTNVKKSIPLTSNTYEGRVFDVSPEDLDWHSDFGTIFIGGTYAVDAENKYIVTVENFRSLAELNSNTDSSIRGRILRMDIFSNFVRMETNVKGTIEYDGNVLQEWDYNMIEQRTHHYDEVVYKVIGDLRDPITNFTELMFQDDKSPRELFTNLALAAGKLIDDVKDLRRTARVATRTVGSYSDLSVVYLDVLNIVERVDSLFNNMKSDVMDFYNNIIDLLEVNIPWGIQQLEDALKSSHFAIEKLFDSPNVGIADTRKMVLKQKAAIDEIGVSMFNISKSSLLAGSSLHFFSTSDVVRTLMVDILHIQDSWSNTEDISNKPIETDPYLMFLGENKTVNDVLQDVMAPLNGLDMVVNPFLKSYSDAVNIFRDMKNKFEEVKRGFEVSKSLINSVFGPKIAKAFPRKIGNTTCGFGYYPTTVDGTQPGIDLEVEVNAALVAPFDGFAKVTANQQVSIFMYTQDISNEIGDIEVIISPVQIEKNRENHPVYKGEVIGTVLKSNCSPNIIHLTMTRIGENKYLNPQPFLERRDVNSTWKEEDNAYFHYFLFIPISTGPYVGDPYEKDTSPTRVARPISLSPSLSSTNHSRSAYLFERYQNQSQCYRNPEQSLLPEIDELGPSESFKVGQITLEQVFNYIEANDDDDLKNVFSRLINMTLIALNNDTCVRPEELDNVQLRLALNQRGVLSYGNRNRLISQFKISDKGCTDIVKGISPNTWCRFDDRCLSAQCCTDVQFMSSYYTCIQVDVKLDTCRQSVTLQANTWTIHLNLTANETAYEDAVRNIPVERIANGEYRLLYRVIKTGTRVEVTLQSTVCSANIDECTEKTTIIDKAVFTMTDECFHNATPAPQLEYSSEDLKKLTLVEFERILDLYNKPDDEITAFMSRLRADYRSALIANIDVSISPLHPNEFSRSTTVVDSSSTTHAYHRNFDVLHIELPSFKIWIFKFQFGYKLTLQTTASSELSLELDSFKLKGGLQVRITAESGGYVKIGPSILHGELSAGGTFGTGFDNCKTIIDRSDKAFQNSIENVLTENTVAFWLQLQVISDPPIVRSWTLLSKKIPLWSSNRNKHSDVSSRIQVETLDVSAPLQNKLTNGNYNLTSPASNPCRVYQIADRDYTQPAYELTISAWDDESAVSVTYCIGSYNSGCDVANNLLMSQTSVIEPRIMVDGMPLYYTATLSNQGDLSITATCDLQTYDLTIPSGRVTPDFLSSSHPSILRASSVINEDSELTSQWEAIGFGLGVYGCQVIQWVELNSKLLKKNVSGAISTEQDSLQYFTHPQDGRLNAEPFETITVRYDYLCGEECLSYPATKCLSFNYDYGDNEICELLQDIQGEYDIHKSGAFKHFERIGVGYTAEHSYSNLTLNHGKLYYFNLYSENVLGYKAIVSSDGVIIDFIPPLTGLIENEEYDAVHHETCTDYVHGKWQDRCIEETPLPNHRYIVDGPGSLTVFNGHTPLVDLMYTRVNTYVSANWDGFMDDETGIYGYTWSVGVSKCLDNIHPHTDPHAHIYDESEWTHQGIASPLFLEDGHYFITVRAINGVEFGGPMATTVCHTTEYTIDSTPPFVYDVYEWEYDDVTCELFVNYNVSDPMSHIREVDVGYGLSINDVYVMDWVRHYTLTNLTQYFCIPDGVPSWVKIRAWNNVDLNEIGYADLPVIVDTTPPTAGDLFDGLIHGIDIDYQNSESYICANWQDFSDAESGIDTFEWFVGTTPYGDDVVEAKTLPPNSFDACDYTVMLLHNTMYYSTLIAYNAGHKGLYTTVTSDGVLIDVTPPTKGWVKDGLDPDNDMSFSSEVSSISANWDEFIDPESGILEYDISIWRSAFGKESEILQEPVTLPGNTNFFNWHHFNLNHGDRIVVNVNAVNYARISTSAKSDGFNVDLTAPKMHFLGDGLQMGEDKEFSSSNINVAANWDFEDVESGIDHFEITVYEKYGGTKQRIYPLGSDGTEIVGPQETSWISPELSLKTGAIYNIRILAINTAGFTNVQDTDGMTVDPTPPEMKSLAIGDMADSSEEVIDGYVLQTDEFGITAYWFGIDYESGVYTYIVGVGTEPGSVDVSGIRDMGPSAGGYIDNLQLFQYDEDINYPVYYVTVKARNGAGSLSDSRISSPIKVVPGDSVGVVLDGAQPLQRSNDNNLEGDVNYQSDATVVTAEFAGFESHLHGIVDYEWAIGSFARGEDIQPFMRAGVVVNDEVDYPGDGIAGSGKAQSLLDLNHGMKYYVTVRAITGVGNVLEAVSNGFTVDATAPEVNIESVGTTTSTQDNTVSSTFYQQSSDSLIAEWTTVDMESDISYTEFCFGSYPGADDIYSCTESTDKSTIPNALVTPASDGVSNVLVVRSINKAGLNNEAVSGSLIVDKTPPNGGVVTCPNYVGLVDTILCSWFGFNDPESGIVAYKFGIGVEEDDDSVFSFVDLEPETDRIVAQDFKVENFNHSQKYYATVVAMNGASFEVKSYSQPIIADGTPPIPGQVIELTGVDYINRSATDFQTNTCIDNTECEQMDAVCQKSMSTVYVMWQQFKDSESEIQKYEVALGTSFGGTQLQDFKTVDESIRMLTITDLDLAYIEQVFVMVRGYNLVGLSVTASSNGVFISRVSAGLPPIGNVLVWDGNTDSDMDYQNDNTQIYGKWNFSGDPCPIIKYEWTIVRFDETVIQPFTLVPDANTEAMNDNLDLRDGESYYIIVKATNAIGYTYSVRSNGITIAVGALLPGIVRDGNIIGTDLNYQASIITLSGNWDGFSMNQQNNNVGDGIAFYEVAAGSDRRYSLTRSDVHPFVSVGQNTSHTFHGLQLKPRTMTYYITVKAHGVSTAVTEVTSNGISVGYGDDPVSTGTVNVARYSKSTGNLTASWSGFLFTMPILFYQWGIMSYTGPFDDAKCYGLQNGNEVVQQMFDKYPLTNVGKDTMVVTNNLVLEDKHTYLVVVVATDQAASCSVSWAKTTIDLSPPTEGRLLIGEYYNERAAYIDRDDEIAVSWDGYFDEESGISQYALQLYDGQHCGAHDSLRLLLHSSNSVPANESSYTFTGLRLEVNHPYFIKLMVTNNADLSITTISMPILIDLFDPVPGAVKDGNTFSSDIMYQFETSKMIGTFLHLPNSLIHACPGRFYSFEDHNTDWYHIQSEGIWGLSIEHRIMFTERQVSVSDSGGLVLIMERDVQAEQMYSAAYYHKEPGIKAGGTYEFEILAASEQLRSITSVVFWDGPEGVVGDFDTWIFDYEFNECPCCDDLNENASCPEKCKCLEMTTTSTTNSYETKSWYLVEDEPEGATGPQNTSLKSTPQPSIGFQIHPGVMVGDQRKHYIVLWGRFLNDTLSPQQTIEELAFDPADGLHNYSLTVKPNQDKSELQLSVDGETLITMYGCPLLSENTTMSISVWNRGDYVPPLDDVFNPPSSTTFVKNVRLPPDESELCRYGDPFRNGGAPIVAFHAGVGSNKKDVAGFMEVVQPCIPCVDPCSMYICDDECSDTDTYEYNILLNNLSLQEYDIDENVTIPAVYHMHIQSVAASGRTATSSSDGIMLDITPPKFTRLYHVDVAWGEHVISDYQSSNDTIAVAWEINEGTSIVDCQWAIGSTPGSNDIQDFVSVGDVKQAKNSKLYGILQNRHKYYVTVTATDEVGLTTTAYTSGVETIFTPPNVSSMDSSVMVESGEIQQISDTSYLATDQMSTGIVWQRVEDNSAGSYYFKIGTEEGKEDIFPSMQVAYNSSGAAYIIDGQLYLNDNVYGNLSQFKHFNKECLEIVCDDIDYTSNTLYMEPGRIMMFQRPAFYMTTVARNALLGPVDITIQSEMGVSISQAPLEHELRLLYWDPDLREWHDASHTCSDSFNEYIYNTVNKSISLKVCGTYTNDEQQPFQNFTGPTHFMLAQVKKDFGNSAPIVTSRLTVMIPEDGGTMMYPITAVDPDNDDIVFQLTENNSTTYGKCNMTSQGLLMYRPCLDCFGTDSVEFTVIEHRDDMIDPLHTTDVLEIHVIEQNDNPDLFVAVEGSNILNTYEYDISVTVEERNPNNTAYEDFIAQVGAYDPDTNDYLTLTFDYPTHGLLVIDDEIHEFSFVPQNCSMFLIEEVTHIPKTFQNKGTVIPYPCDLMLPHEIDRYAWVVTRIRYIPKEHYYGQDQFQINSADSDGAVSRVAKIIVHVLENRCVNGGICKGPAEDPDCSSPRRSEGFDDYTCYCPPGYTGDYCGVEINECLSNPCADNFTCYDKVYGYICQCDNMNWPCAPQMESRKLYLMAVLLSILLLLLVLLSIYIYGRKKNMKVGPMEDNLHNIAMAERQKSGSKKTNKVYPLPMESHLEHHGKDETEVDTTNDEKNIIVIEKGVNKSEEINKQIHSDVELKDDLNNDSNEEVSVEGVMDENKEPILDDSTNKLEQDKEDSKHGTITDRNNRIAQRFGFFDGPRSAKFAWTFNIGDQDNDK
uniref:Uncharacterized protein LOC102804939 n=1 Tax=Saccoglossus kowalevskii TaxID=10224 RepID=A0ABM0MJ45_SACKO|nr:PREDICTED: uncharacterized protein LOC102804939 [Saccoglossus kowalevskii]